MGKTKSRGNGQGTAYRRGKTWEARVVIGWKLSGDPPHNVPIYKTKGGFPTKRDAVQYIPTLLSAKATDHKPETLIRNVELWKEQYEPRIAAHSMKGYISALKHFSDLYYKRIDTITAVDIQGCFDRCDRNRRTKDVMRVAIGLVFKYALDANQIMKIPYSSIYMGEDNRGHRAPLTEEELSRIEKSGLPYSDYIVAMSYLGHRPTEFFNLKKQDYYIDGDIHYLVGGIKTEAGIDRAVTIPPHVLPIIQRRLVEEGTDYLFPRYRQRKAPGDTTTIIDQMPTGFFSKYIWKPIMDELGIVGKVPYATRHTYANKMKRVTGDEKDKAGLMGHASYELTREHYQTTSLDEKKAITDQLK